MSVTIQSTLIGQINGTNTNYCYLYEPLFVTIGESDTSATSIYIDILVKNTSNDQIVDLKQRYAEYDLAPNVKIQVDLMKLVRQIHDANIYKFNSVFSSFTSQSSKESVVSKYVYEFRITSNLDSTAGTIKSLPIIGGRNYTDFTTFVLPTQELTEFSDISLSSRWRNVPIFNNSLASLNSLDKSPIITWSIDTTNSEDLPIACGGILIWKSRFGGWCSWGMDYKSITESSRYNGRLDVGMLESTLDTNGQPFIQPNYTGINLNKNVELKSFSLSSDELKAVSGIGSSPAIYYTEENWNRFELMRLNSFTAPINNHISGGDFTVSLSSISTQEFKTR